MTPADKRKWFANLHDNHGALMTSYAFSHVQERVLIQLKSKEFKKLIISIVNILI